jgi:hypothetical protein
MAALVTSRPKFVWQHADSFLYDVPKAWLPVSIRKWQQDDIKLSHATWQAVPITHPCIFELSWSQRTEFTVDWAPWNSKCGLSAFCFIGASPRLYDIKAQLFIRSFIHWLTDTPFYFNLGITSHVMQCSRARQASLVKWGLGVLGIWVGSK